MCRISNGFTNHSLTCMELRTYCTLSGKSSQKTNSTKNWLESLRQYECTSASQLVDISNIMAGTSKDLALAVIK